MKLEIENLYNLEDKELDIILIFAKNFLDIIASGKRIHYFEKKAGEIIKEIYRIKKERIFK